MKFDSTGLAKDINNYMSTFASVFITKAMNKLENKAKSLVVYFYTDYSPRQYIRTYHFLDNAVEVEINIGKTAKIYEGKINLLSGVYSEHYLYSDESMTDEEIRMESWEGLRGKGESTSPSPLSYLMDFYNGGKFKRYALKDAKTAANSIQYKYLKK